MERFDALLFCYQNKIHIFVLKYISVMINIAKSKFIDKDTLGTSPVWHIVHREFLAVCPHCAQNIYNFVDAISTDIKWNELLGHHIPIGGLRKSFPHDKRMKANLLRCYKNDDYMFHREKCSPYGYINFYSIEDAVTFLKTIIIPDTLPFDPSIYKSEESKAKREELIEQIAKDEYFIIPVYPADNSEYCIDGKIKVESYRKLPDISVAVLPDIYVTIEVEQFIK